MGRELVKLTDGDHSVHAIFTERQGRKGLNMELAAYRLDRMLHLDMIPVTVAREVDGDQGTLQFLPENTRTEAERAASGRGANARCPLPRQWDSVYVFDTLIYDEGRAPSSMVYNAADWQLMLVGNQNSFGTRTDRPRYLANVPLAITATWVEALVSLSDEALTEQLGDVLDKRRIAALARRRDMLLSEARE
jgi:hypothetical protein